MTDFTFTSPDGKSYTVSGPEGATSAQAFQILQQQLGSPAPSDGGGFVGALKDFAGGIARAGLGGGPAQFGTMSPAESADLAPSGVPNAQAAAAIPPAQSRYVGAVGEAVGNPASYIGPGGLPLKIGTAVASGAGSEAGRQATEGTGYEPLGSIGGALLGGIGAVKALGPGIPKAAIPTPPELNAAADTGYGAFRNSGVEVDPRKFADWALQQEQYLSNSPKYAFTGGQYGTAPKTLNLIEQWKKFGGPPPGTDLVTADQAAALRQQGSPTITAANLDTMRRNIGDIAGETQPGPPGTPPKPTSDAKAAMVLKRAFADYLENPPADHVIAGDAGAMSDAIKQANGDYAALSRIGNVDYRVSKAENANERALTGSLGDRMQAAVGRMLDNPKSLRGFSPEAISQIQDINAGSVGHNALRQIGRFSNYSPLQIPLAVLSGGAYLPQQVAAGVISSGAKHLADKSIISKVDALVQTLAKESPEYARRLKSLPPADAVSGKAAIVRALLNAH